MRFHPARVFRAALAVSLAISALLFFLCSWRWPLVGDASLIHYIAWLTQRGWAPYRQISDMNMPGSYLIEIAAMHIFGSGALAWRLFDFTLMAAAAAAFFAITKNSGAPFVTASSSRMGAKDGWFAALFAASLFILSHGRDGLAQGGQRDLTMAVCLIVATAFLVHSVRMRSAMYAATFGLLSGIAFTIKPTAPLLTVAQLALALYAFRAIRTSPNEQPATSNQQRQLLLTAALAFLVAPAIVLVFLLRERALAAFLATIHTLVPYYAGLGHRPLSFILLHSISPALPLVLVWLAVLAFLPRRRSEPREFRRDALLLGVIFGIVNCIVQARALPYYRYPLLVFLLPLIALDLTRALDFLPPAPVRRTRAIRTRTIQALAVLGLGFGGFFFAPQSAILIHSYRWRQIDFISSLTQDLNSLGGQQLSHKVLCIDTNSGCGNVLYNMRLEPANGILSDFFLFGDSDVPVVRQTRQEMTRDLVTDPPRVIIVTSTLYLGGADALDYRKLDRWTAFAHFLATRYTLETQWSPTRIARWWSRDETPASYRIYVLRPLPSDAIPRTALNLEP